MTGVTRLELATFRSTGDCSDRLSYTPAKMNNILSLNYSSWDGVAVDSAYYNPIGLLLPESTPLMSTIM